MTAKGDIALKKYLSTKNSILMIALLGFTGVLGLFIVLFGMAATPSRVKNRPASDLLFDVSVNNGHDETDPNYLQFDVPKFRVYGDGLTLCGGESGSGVNKTYKITSKSLSAAELAALPAKVTNTGLFDVDKNLKYKRVFLSSTSVTSVTTTLTTAKKINLDIKDHAKVIVSLNNLMSTTCAGAKAYSPDSVTLNTTPVKNENIPKGAKVTNVKNVIFPPNPYNEAVKGQKAKDLYGAFKAKRSHYIRVTTDKNTVYRLDVIPDFRKFTAPKLAKASEKGIVSTVHGATNKPVQGIRMMARDQVNSNSPTTYPSGTPTGTAICTSMKSYFRSQIARDMHCVPGDEQLSASQDMVGKLTVAEYKDKNLCLAELQSVINETGHSYGSCSSEKEIIWMNTFREFYREGHTTVVLIPFGTHCSGVAGGVGDGTDGYGVLIKTNGTYCNGSTTPTKTQLAAHEAYHAMTYTADHTATNNNLMRAPYACQNWSAGCTMNTSQKDLLKQTPYFFTSADIQNDKTPPSKVPGLTSPRQTQNRISLQWQPASDNSNAIAYYDIYSHYDKDLRSGDVNEYKNPDCKWKDFTRVASTQSSNGEPAPVTYYEAAGFNERQVFSFFIIAVDAAGNESLSPKAGSSQCDIVSAPIIKTFQTMKYDNQADDVVDTTLETARAYGL